MMSGELRAGVLIPQGKNKQKGAGALLSAPLFLQKTLSDLFFGFNITFSKSPLETGILQLR